MRRFTVCCAFVVLLTWLPVGQGQEQQAKRNEDLKRILDGLKEQAEAQKKEDRRRALLLVQQAQTAERNGQLAEAVNLAQKASRLFPESDEVKQYERSLAQQQRLGRERAINLAVAQRRMEEALDRADDLLRGGKPDQARDLADAVRQTLELPAFQGGGEAEKLRRTVEKMLREMKPREPDSTLEELPAPVRDDPAVKLASPQPMIPTGLAIDSLKRALTQRVSLSWRDQPLDVALAELSQVSGVPIGLDPALMPPGPTPQARFNLRVHRATIDRVLRLLGELTGGGYILADGQVVFTTKSNALEFVLTGKYGTAEFVAPGPVIRPVSGVLPKPLRPLAQPKAPEYLESGKAFRDHLSELLEPPTP
jgi:tetratricopeptide (TPR) repeat protein